jgi:hypothetical protein
VGGNIYTAGNLNVAGTTNLGVCIVGSLTTTNTETNTGGISGSGSLATTTTLTVGGDASLNSRLYVLGNLSVGGNVTLPVNSLSQSYIYNISGQI